jgi:transcriptional regulator with XRE-family HTH domain
LEPIGIGTLEVESLTSYIARVAWEHCVSPRILIIKEMFELIGKPIRRVSTACRVSANQLNGMGSLVEMIVPAFEQLTLQHKLHSMTMLTWKGILSHHKLLRSHRAWCAFCYEEQSIEKKPIYDPLIWSVEPVSVCHLHHYKLCQICPRCNRNSYPFNSNYRPGYCSCCKEWLGTRGNKKALRCAKEPTAAELSEQISNIDIIGDLLSKSSDIKLLPTYRGFVVNLTKHIDKDADSSLNLFSEISGIWSGTIRRLLHGFSRVTIKMLCKICSKLNVSPIDLLINKQNEVNPERSSVERKEVSSSVMRPTPWNEVESKLRSALLEYPPPSLEAVADSMGYYRARIKSNFPKLSEQIISRYKEYLKSKHPSPDEVQKVFTSALKEQPPPSLQSVFRRLGCRDTGYYYYTHYEQWCIKVARRYKSYRDKPFNRDSAQEELQAALIEDPPPSFSAIAKRLGHSREFVRQKFPELSKAIVARYLKYLADLRKHKAERLRKEIRNAIRQITASGLYVSEARVKTQVRNHLPGPGRDSLFKQAFREIKAEMGMV